MEALRTKYEKLGLKPEFQALRATVPTIATWDDHDYGANDAGKDYRPATESREIFFDFWREPLDSPDGSIPASIIRIDSPMANEPCK